MQNHDECEFSKANTLKMTIWWLKENYEYSEGVSIPRKVLYDNYIRCCLQFNFNPISSATFGKIIRQQFPQITTRRLGTRGQSKYHYHGLAVKVTSIDFDPAFSKSILAEKEVHFVNVIHPKNRSDVAPTIKISMLHQSSGNEEGENADLNHFLVMYQTHSQQILDSIIQGSFEEVGNFLSSFWRGCPENFKYLFSNQRLISSVILLDIQVYISVCQTVLPSMNRILPETYLKDFVLFLYSISSVLTSEISNVHYDLKRKKLKYAIIFKQMCLNWLKASHMLEIIYPLFEDTKIISQILEDFQDVVLEDVIFEVVMNMSPSQRVQFAHHFDHYFEELENIMENNFSVDDISTLCTMIYSQDFQEDHRAIYLGWSSFLSRFIDSLLLQKASSFVHVSLIFMWLEHLLYIECILKEFQKFTLSSKELNGYESTMEVKIPDGHKIDHRSEAIHYIPEQHKYWRNNANKNLPFNSNDVMEHLNNEIIHNFEDPVPEEDSNELWSL